MKKIIFILISICVITLSANNDFIITEPEITIISKDARAALKKKGYQTLSDEINNGFVRVKKGKKYTYSDIDGNIQKKKYAYVTPMSKNATFMSAEPKAGTNDHGGKDTQSFTNLILRNADGSVLKDIAAINPDYHLASHQVHQSRFYETDSTSYNTFHTVLQVPDTRPDGSSFTYPVSKEGLIDDQGNIVLEPKYASIKQINGSFFELKDGRKDAGVYLMNIEIMNRNPMSFEKFKAKKGGSHFGENMVFDNKLIAKSNGKYGIFNLDTQQWALPNQYDELDSFFATKNIGTNDPNGAQYSKIMFTNKFTAKKDGLWGAIKANGEIIVPFNYKQLMASNYDSDKFFEVTKTNGKKNLYDIELRAEYFPKSFDTFSIDSRRNNVVVVKDGGRVGLISVSPYAELVPFSNGYVDYTFQNNSKTFLFKDKDRKKSLYSINQNKVIWKDAKSIKKVNGKSGFIVVRNFEKQVGIIDGDGNIVLPFGRYSGAVKERNGHFMFYSVHKPNKVKQCVARSGEILAPRDCQ